MSKRPATLDLDSLPNEVGPLREIVRTLASDYQTLLERFESLTQQVLELRRRTFGASAEQLARQGDLFSEAVTLPVPPERTETITYERPARGRPRLPKHLPRERIEYTLSAAECLCGNCGESLTRIGEEVSEQLDFVPARLKVLEHARAKYACGCESGVVTAPMPAPPLPKSNASAPLLAHILVSKYQDHLPLNRQERIFARHGIELARSTLCDWALGSAQLLAVLMNPLKAHVLAAPKLHVDDTVVPLLNHENSRTTQARAWVYVAGGPAHPAACLVAFTENRKGEHVQGFLKDYRGYIQADAYAGFDALYATGERIEVACHAHARRKFFEIAQAQKSPGLAHTALGFIGGLYDIERTLRDEPPDKKRLVRQEKAVPILNDYKQWLEGNLIGLLPKSPTAAAIHYTLSNWKALMRYTEAGFLDIDNNKAERAIRPIAVGRGNWLFVGSERGGEAAAVILSLIETCKLQGIEPYHYLADVLKRLPSHPINRVAQLLPFHWKTAPRAALADAA